MTYATMHSTAVGKSILAFLHPSEALQNLKNTLLRKHSSKTVASERMILAQTGPGVRARGCAIDDEETEIGARCIAAPIFNGHGRPVAAIIISGPVNYMRAKMCLKMAKSLKETNSGIPSNLVSPRAAGMTRKRQISVPKTFESYPE
jgi:DNA-binding IclR family transcriptional regulator